MGVDGPCNVTRVRSVLYFFGSLGMCLKRLVPECCVLYSLDLALSKLIDRNFERMEEGDWPCFMVPRLH